MFNYKLFDNSYDNECDFKNFMSYFLKNDVFVLNALHTPIAHGKDVEEMSEQDIKQYKLTLNKWIDKYKNDCPKALVINENGTYFFPLLYQGKSYGESKDRFVRMYIGLHCSKIFEFFKLLDKELKDKQVNYNYKFFNMSNNESDRAVLYCNNEDIFVISNTIESIYEQRPDIFKGACNKYFSTKICNGIGVASDLNYSFTSIMEKVLNKFIHSVLKGYGFNKSNPFIDNYIYESILNSYNLDANQQEKDKFGKLDFEKIVNFSKIKEQVFQAIDKFLDGKRTFSSKACNLELPNGKFVVTINLAKIIIKSLPFNQNRDAINELTSFNRFKQFISQSNAENNLSLNNIAFSEQDLNILEDIFNRQKNV